MNHATLHNSSKAHLLNGLRRRVVETERFPTKEILVLFKRYAEKEFCNLQ
jgi:hypothetical protein